MNGSSLRKIRLAYATNLLNIVPSLAFNLWLYRLVVTGASDPEIGIYGQISQIGLYLTTLQLGLDFAASQRISAAIGSDDLDSAKRAFLQLRLFNRIIGFIILLLVCLGVILSWRLVQLQEVSRETTVGLIATIGLIQVVSIFGRTATATVFGCEAAHLLNTITIVRSLAILPLGFVFFRMGCGIVSLPLAELLCQSSAAIITQRFLGVVAPWAGEMVVDSGDGFSSMAKYGISAAIGNITWTIEAGIDVFLLNWITGGGGLPAVAAYGVWWRFPSMAFTVCTGLAASAFPSFSKAFAESPSQSRRLFEKVSVNSFGLGTLAAVGVSLWLPAFIHHWMGGRFDRPDDPYLSTAIGALLGLRVFGNLLALYWLAQGKAALTTILNVIQLAVKLLLGCWLIQNYGLFGAFLAAAIAVIVQIAGVGTALIRTGSITPSRMTMAFFFFGLTMTLAALASTSLAMVNPTTWLIGAFLTGLIGIVTIKFANRALN